MQDRVVALRALQAGGFPPIESQPFSVPAEYAVGKRDKDISHGTGIYWSRELTEPAFEWKMSAQAAEVNKRGSSSVQASALDRAMCLPAKLAYVLSCLGARRCTTIRTPAPS
eukprot:2608264-Amphidinium_carterae.1